MIIATSACLGSVVVVERWLLRLFLVAVVLSEEKEMEPGDLRKTEGARRRRGGKQWRQIS